MAPKSEPLTATHEVFNQPPPLVDYNLFGGDRVLTEAVEREGAKDAAGELTRLGGILGRRDTIEAGFAANANPPRLLPFDRYGNRRDEVEFHPAYHAMLGLAVEHGLHCSPWAEPRPGAHVARAAGTYMLTQVESGVYCPIAMTYGSVPTLRREAAISAEWLPRVFSRVYDKRFRPVTEKTGVLLGMGMTEKQGGSDLRANTTRAEPVGNGSSRVYRLTGHKWFLSAPMCDAFLMLAQAPAGPSCFLVPRWTPDGAMNGLRLQRLKDKLGNRSNASSEVELVAAWGLLVGEEGRGIPIIIEMGNLTRLDCAIGSAGLMRQAILQAIHHAQHRSVFQKRLVDQPLMTNVLADLALESEAAAVLAFRLARAYDGEDAGEIALRRLLTPVAKYWICKRAPALALEAMEVLGGNGYVEESIMPRVYREMPVNSVWEGSANVICLDVRRALEKSAEAADAFLAEIRSAAGADRRLDRFAGTLETELGAARRAEEGLARRLVGRMAVGLQAALLVRHAPAAVADAFCAARLENEAGGDFRYAAGGCRQSRDRGSRRSRMNETSPTPSASDDRPSRRGRGSAARSIRLPETLFRYVFDISAKHQVLLLLLTVAVFLIELVPLELQRRIINDLVKNRTYGYIITLCVIYGGVVLVHGSTKLVLNLYRNWVGERSVRDLRERIRNLVGLSSVAEADPEAQGVEISMIVAEVEPVGAFVGSSVSEPLLQGGVMLSVLAYMIHLDPWMALLAFAIFVPQLIFVPLMQKAIIERTAARVQVLRGLSISVVEAPSRKEGERMEHGPIQRVFELDMGIFKLKFTMNFLMNFCNQLQRIAALLLGGWYVLNGQLEVGGVVAFISGVEKLNDPWGDLINYFRDFSVAHVKYRLVATAVDDLMEGEALAAAEN